MAGSTTVVGGGIAGCAACLSLADLGIEVTWVAPPAPAGDRPGESLAAGAGPLLERIGVGHLLDDPAHRRVEATFSSWGSEALLERSSAARPGRMGHVVHRSRFDAALAAEVNRRPGISIIAGEITSVRRDARGWRLTTDAGERISSRFVVDATGRKCAIGRTFTSLHRGDRLIAAYAFLDQVDRDVEPTPATLIEAVATGWWYATLLADGRLALNYYSDPDLMPHGVSRDAAAWQALAAQTRYISRWIESAGFDLSRPPSLASAGTTWLSQAAGTDWIAVGDAAAAFDPLSAHGMTTALWTGIAAGRAVQQALEGTFEGIDSYAERVRHGVDQFRTDRDQIYGRETRFAEQPFWLRRRRGARPPEDESTGRIPNHAPQLAGGP